MQERKVELKQQCAKMLDDFSALEPTIAACEREAESIAAESGQLKLEDLKARTTSSQSSVIKAKATFTEMQQGLKVVCDEVTTAAELMELQGDLVTLNIQLDSYDARLRKASALAGRTRQLALQQAFAEYDALRLEVAAKLRVFIEAQGMKADALFGAIAGESSTEVTRDQVVAFLEKCKCDIEREKLDKIFSSDGDNGNEGSQGKVVSISKEDFMRVVRIYYKVVKEIVLSDNLLIEQSGQIRRMEMGEVMEVFEGPKMDPSVGVYRIHGRALRDGTVGWVTVAGNQGITFLLPGGNVWQVSKPTPLCEGLKDIDGTATVKIVNPGEVLEVIDWGRTSSSALGVTRLKVRVQGDSVVGWASLLASDGSVQLEVS